MKTLLEAYLAIHTDRFNARWLCKRDPQLWAQVVAATSFLPDEALPKQRVWHIMNDVWAVPLCPVDGVEVKWFENRYLTYSSGSAKARSPVVRDQMLSTYEAKTGTKGHWSADPEVRARILTKRLANPQKGFKRSPEWHAKIKKTWDDKLNVDDRDRSALRRYRADVMRFTLRSYREHGHLFAPGQTRSKATPIDHIFSVYDAWRLGVSPKVVGHWTNLRIIDQAENNTKHIRSDKSLDQLYCDILD